jgi:hypothetical protein
MVRFPDDFFGGSGAPVPYRRREARVSRLADQRRALTRSEPGDLLFGMTNDRDLSRDLKKIRLTMRPGAIRREHRPIRYQLPAKGN